MESAEIPGQNISDSDLLAQYVATFEKLDELVDFNIPEGLPVHESEYGGWIWQPIRFSTSPSALKSLYHDLGLSGQGSGRLPPLYEALILSYRWGQVDLVTYRLLPNWPAQDFSPLLSTYQVYEGLRATLMPNGFFQFGQGPGVDFDPVCFDFRHRQKNGDCRIVKINHEDILIRSRINVIEELAHR